MSEPRSDFRCKRVRGVQLSHAWEFRHVGFGCLPQTRFIAYECARCGRWTRTTYVAKERPGERPGDTP